MPVTVQIDGVGKVQLDDGFQSLSPEQQQATIDEISSSAKRSAPAATPGAPSAPTPTGAAPAPKEPRGNQNTYQALERFIKTKYPTVKFTSDYRDPTHNRSVGGVEGSYHTTHQAVDMTGLDDKQREALKQDLITAGAAPREFLFHDAGSGMHLHVAADHVSDDFLKQWGNQEAAAPGDADATPDRQAEIASAQAEASKLLQAGKQQEAIDLLGKHRLKILPGELEAFSKGKRTAGFTHRDSAPPVEAPATDEEPGGHILDVISNNAGRGVLDSVGFAADAAIGSLIPALAGRTFGKASDALQKAYTAMAGEEEPQGLAERVAGLGTRFIAGAAVPAGEIGPAIPKAIEGVRDARFVGRQVKDPRAPFIAEVVQDLAKVAKEHAPNGVVPKGRGPVTVAQIGDLERSYLVGLKAKIGKLDVPEASKQRLREAIERKYTIGSDELAGLKGTTEGDAVALGIQKVQALRDLTPPYNGSKPGFLPTLAEMGTNIGLATASGNPLMAAGGTVLRKLMRAFPGDVNASRLDAARKVLKRERAYGKVADKVGPSGQREAASALNQKFEQTLAAREAGQSAPKAARMSPQDALLKVNIESGTYGRHNMYADSLGVKRADVESVLPHVDTSDIPAFEMEKFTHGYPVSKAVRTALLPRLRKALADKGITPSSAENQAAKAHPNAEAAAGADERIYRPVEDQARYDVGKSRSQSLQKYERSQFETQMPKEIVEATKPDIDHIVDVARTGESGLQYFDTHTASKLRQMGLDDAEISDVRSHIERIVSHKRYQTEAAFDAGAKRK